MNILNNKITKTPCLDRAVFGFFINLHKANDTIIKERGNNAVKNFILFLEFTKFTLYYNLSLSIVLEGVEELKIQVPETQISIG